VSSPRLEKLIRRSIAPLLGASVFALTACSKPGFPIYPDGAREFAYVANSASNTVTVLDLVYLRPDRTLSVGNDPVALAVNPQRDEVYVVNSQPGQSSGSVSVIDTNKNVVTATIPVQRNPSFIAVDKTGQRAFVTNTGSNSVTVLDLATHQAIATVATGSKPDAAAISPDGRTLVVTNTGSGTITVFSAGIPPLTTKTTLVTPIGFGPPLTLRATFSGCPGATSPVILPDSSKTFVACSGSQQVMAIWLGAAPDSWFAKQDSSFSNDHVLAVLDVGRNPTNVALKPDGGEIFVSNRDSDSVSEIATQTDEVESTYPIGNRPAHGLASVDGALWVSNLGGDAVSLYSIDDGKLVPPVRTGVSPDALAFGNDGNLLLAANTRSGDVAVIRTSGKLGPGLFTMLPAGGSPAAIVVKSMPAGR
jgi:YVTN family beta-propeller protein